jgi:hypothetical protein
MINPPSGLITGIEAETRNPSAKLEIDWNMNVASGEWADLDAYSFQDESDNIINIEIFSEMGGDSDQYSTADFDCELSNANNRYTPKANKNILKNSGFELDFKYWSSLFVSPASGQVMDDYERSGRKYLKITNPSSGHPYVFSDRVSIFSTDGYHYITNETDEYYNLSFYVIGSGQLSIGLRAYDITASGSNDIDTGFIVGSIEEISF